MKHTILFVLALGLSTANANADMIWYTQTTSPLNSAADWNSELGGSGSPPAALPIVGDTDTWVVDINNRTFWNLVDTTWYGGTTIVNGINGRDEVYHKGLTLTMQDVVLQGGDNPRNTGAAATWNGAALNLDNDNRNKFAGNTLTIASGYTGSLGMERRSASIAFSTYTGDGDMLVSGWDNGHQLVTGTRGPYRFVDGGDFSTFTGSITFERINAGFDYDISSATFDMIIQTEAVYNLANSVNVTSLTVDGLSFGAGTYGYSDFVTAGKDAFFTDAGGSITVSSGSSGPAADANNDGVVDAADYIVLKQNFGTNPGVDGGGASVGDFNKDGFVDWADLTLLAGEINPAANEAVPEPSSVMLLFIGTGWLLRRRRS